MTSRVDTRSNAAADVEIAVSVKSQVVIDGEGARTIVGKGTGHGQGLTVLIEVTGITRYSGQGLADAGGGELTVVTIRISIEEDIVSRGWNWCTASSSRRR